MSLVGFTFGSFGDIITIIGLAVQVHKALSESAGSSEEYQDLLADLGSFSQLLQIVQSASLITWPRQGTHITRKRHSTCLGPLEGPVGRDLCKNRRISEEFEERRLRKHDEGPVEEDWMESVQEGRYQRDEKTTERLCSEYHNTLVGITVVRPLFSLPGINRFLMCSALLALQTIVTPP